MQRMIWIILFNISYFKNIVNRLQQMFFRTLRIRKEVWKKLLQV